MGVPLRGQTLCRTAFGMAEYEEALLLQAQAEQPASRPAALELVRTKFEMLFACQNYGEFKRNGEAPAADVELLLRALPGLRVVYHHKEKKGGGEAHAAVLIAGDGAGGVRELSRVALPGMPIIGEGKPRTRTSGCSLPAAAA